MRNKLSWIVAFITGLFILMWTPVAFAMESRSGSNLKGIDVSHWDGAIDWKRVAASRVQFAYIKATGGTNFTDARFSTNVRNARANGIAVGAYHYAKPTAPFCSGEPAAQANFFVRTMHSSMNGCGDMMPVLDLEETGGLSARELVEWTRIFVNTVERQTHRTVMLYTSVDFIQRNSDLETGLSNMPLWVAYYDRFYGGGAPPNIAGWNRWLVWQYTDEGKVNGLSVRADLNAGPTSLSALRGDLMQVDGSGQNTGSAYLTFAQSNVQPWPPLLPSKLHATQSGTISSVARPTADHMNSLHRNPVFFLCTGLLILIEITSICVVWSRRRKKTVVGWYTGDENVKTRLEIDNQQEDWR